MSIFDDLLGRTGADAARRAAGDTYTKQAAAGNEMRQAGNTAYNQYTTAAGAYDPYVWAGNSALSRLMVGLGFGGDTAGFTNAYRSLPGYQSGLETGTNAALRGVNASGMSNSGAALKALQRFGSNYEDQRVGDYLGRLGGLAGQGLGATGARAGIQGQGVNALYGANMGAASGDYNAAGTVGQGEVAAAQSQQDAIGNLLKTAGYLGGAALGGPAGAGLAGGLTGGGGSFLTRLFTGGQGFGTGNRTGNWWQGR